MHGGGAFTASAYVKSVSASDRSSLARSGGYEVLVLDLASTVDAALSLALLALGAADLGQYAKYEMKENAKDKRSAGENWNGDVLDGFRQSCKELGRLLWAAHGSIGLLR